MPAQVVEYVRRNSDLASPRSALWRPVITHTPGQFGDRAVDRDYCPLQVEVITAKGCQLAEAETAVCGEKNQCTPTRRNCVRDGLDLLDAEGGPCGVRFLTCASKHAGVAADLLVTNGGRANRMQQSVELRGRAGSGSRGSNQAAVPRAHRRCFEVAQFDLSELGQDVLASRPW